ncbi:MAG: winged helix-turn-helix domain-containing protein [Promethearchaeota archaeon]
MTEGKIAEPTQEQIESSKDDEVCEPWGMLVTKSTVRLKIWQILELFGEMNVTQISNLLKESKSTVSRHLNSMEQDDLVKSRKVESTWDGRIASKVFNINSEIKLRGGMDQSEGLPKDFKKRIEFIKSEIQTNRSSIIMMTGIMELLLPIYNEVESLIKQDTEESLKKADELFNQFMWGDKGENIAWFKFGYHTPKMQDLTIKIYNWSRKILKDDYDLEKFNEERLELKEEMVQAKKEQEDPTISKKYAQLGIDVPLRKIFMKNRSK